MAQWWAVPEGVLGDVVNNLAAFDFGWTRVHWHAVQSAKKPSGGNVFGPYSTKAKAQAKADNLNSHVNGPLAVGNASANAGRAATSALGIPKFTNTRDFMVRAVKVVIGVSLIIIGLAEIAKPGQVLGKLPPVVPV